MFDHRILFFSTCFPTRSTILLHPGPTFLSLFSFSRRSGTLNEILFLSTHGNRGKLSCGALEEEPALSIGKEAAYPRDDVFVSTLGFEGGGELGWVNIVEPSLDVEQE